MENIKEEAEEEAKYHLSLLMMQKTWEYKWKIGESLRINRKYKLNREEALPFSSLFISQRRKLERKRWKVKNKTANRFQATSERGIL